MWSTSACILIAEGTIEDYTALLEQANQNEVSQYCYRIGRIFHFINFQLKWYVEINKNHLEINKNHLNFAPNFVQYLAKRLCTG